jgi:hypothetical protein
MLDFPFMVFAFSLVVLWVSIQIGTFVGQKLRPLPDDEREDFGIVINATLTLLALIIGFSFSMAVSRYDQRKNYEEAEANAIGTEYVRAGLLPSADVVRIRELLTQYLDQRLLFYTIRDPLQVERIANATAALQNRMWDIVQSAALARPTPPITLTVSGMNDVLNSQGYTQAAWWNRIPIGAWSLMIALAIFCSLLIGYDARHRGFRLLMVFPLIVSVAFFLVADIDSPRNGVIRVMPQNLISLSQSLHKSSDRNEKDSR